MSAPGPAPARHARAGAKPRTLTNFLLAYLADGPLRRRIGAQLNKGDMMHALRRHIAFDQRQQLALATEPARLGPP